MRKYRLLDLFSGAGGATKGYQMAGFYVVGVDIKAQPHYCGDEFHQADAMTYPLEGFDVIHASPPCQRYSCSTKKTNRDNHPDLIGPIRKRLLESGATWIIENVPGSPLRGDIVLCGWSVGNKLLQRRRIFESNTKIFALLPGRNHYEHVITVAGTGTPTGSLYIFGRQITKKECQEAMGIDWMTRKELNNAIPPAYTFWIGKQLIRYLDSKERI